MNVKTLGLNWYTDAITDGRRFSFTRYGNGEWECILGLHHETRSHSQEFNPDLRQALSDSLMHAPGGRAQVATQSVTYLERSRLLHQAEAWLARYAPGLDWYDGEVFHHASANGKLFPFVQALRRANTVIVGPPWLLCLPFARVFIPVPEHNAWNDLPRLLKQCAGLENAVVCLSAGPLAKVLIHQLYPLIGAHSWLIDCGSLWDPYVGVLSRRYHKRMSADTLRRNMEGA